MNRVFRAAHSIKGGAGFFDLVKIRELAHKTENALDLVRSPADGAHAGGGEHSAAGLRQAARADRQSPGEQPGRHQRVRRGADRAGRRQVCRPSEKSSLHEQVDSAAAATPNKHIQVSAFDLSQARQGGKCVYLIEYDLIHDIERRDKTPWEVFKSLIKCGTILETVFDLDSAGTLDDEPSNRLMLEVLYATVLEPDLLRQAGGCSAGASPADREERRIHGRWPAGSRPSGAPSQCAELAPVPVAAETCSRRRPPATAAEDSAPKPAGGHAGSGRRDHHPAERDACSIR